MFNALLENLTNIGWAMLIFLCAYLANVAFSLWYNIKIRKEDFDREKLIASGLKILVFVVGLTLLCTAITALPILQTKSAGLFLTNTRTFSPTWSSLAPFCLCPVNTSRKPSRSSLLFEHRFRGKCGKRTGAGSNQRRKGPDRLHGRKWRERK